MRAVQMTILLLTTDKQRRRTPVEVAKPLVGALKPIMQSGRLRRWGEMASRM